VIRTQAPCPRNENLWCVFLGLDSKENGVANTKPFLFFNDNCNFLSENIGLEIGDTLLLIEMRTYVFQRSVTECPIYFGC